MFEEARWAGSHSTIAQHVLDESRRTLDAYRIKSLLVLEHANIERATAQGGYGRRQIYELVQNGADALISAPGGTIHVVLTEEALYCANEGEAIDVEGVDAILSSHVSMKRGTEIGRFGLGFKSVLGVTKTPQFYSQSGSFGFDAEAAARQIREVVPHADRVPVLRVAQPLDSHAIAAGDATLAELMSWATTVVMLPRDLADSSWLSEDIRAFPSEFLLFSPHVGALILEDRAARIRREVELVEEDGQYVLAEGAETTAWQVFSRQHIPSEAARNDAGELADRESMPVIWAVPTQGRKGRGQFWAFFPTEYKSTLKGIINAPWKTNEDRQNLLTGAFNVELIGVVADLVVESLPRLLDEEDPGAILDLLPSRRDESPNWADESLNDLAYEAAGTSPSMPDQSGRLVSPSSLQLHPPGLSKEALDSWAEYSKRPENWCHSSVETRERRSRAERLIEASDGSIESMDVWLEALAEDRTPEASVAALRVASIIVRVDSGRASEVRDAAIVLSSDGRLLRPVPGDVFLPGSYEALRSDLDFVHPEVAGDERGRVALDVLGIHPVDASGELETFVAEGLASWRKVNWYSFWTLVRRVGAARASEILLKRMSETARVEVLTVSGVFRPLHQTLLPGPIVPEDGSRDADVAVDTKFHNEELDVLTRLGAVSAPTPSGGSFGEEWFLRYRLAAIAEFEEQLPASSSRPQQDYLEFDRITFTGPLAPMLSLSDEGRARMTDAVLAADSDIEPWTLSHATRRDVYPAMQFVPPTIWLVKKEGRLSTSLGYRSVDESVGASLDQWSEVLPTVNSEIVTTALDLPNSLNDLFDEDWQAAFDRLENIHDDHVIGRFYSEACGLIGTPPDKLWCRVGEVHQLEDRRHVTIVLEQRELDALKAQGIPTLLVPSRVDADALIRNWGLASPSRLVRTEVYHVPLGPQAPLIEVFPTLRWLVDEAMHSLHVVRCSTLRLETLTEAGKVSEDKDFHLSEQTIYWSSSLNEEFFLDRVVAEFGVELAPGEREAILEHQADEERRRTIRSIRSQASPEAKLLAAVGASNIRRRLPAGLIEAVEVTRGAMTDELLSELAFSVYGVDVLHVFRSDLEEAGLHPPSQWGGSRSARAFVRELGFSRQFAGFEQARRDPLLEVDGPPDLPALHEFQGDIKAEFRRVLNGEGGLRGLLSLPTGAGKTRVAVEALVDAVREEHFSGPILWIAQTDELCEQAVQTWSYVWRSIGPRGRLNISRLWAANEAEPIDEGTQVVVATIAKLQGCFDQESYAWLSRPTCVVVDEAHGSITPSFTALLEWLEMSRGRDRCPLIGLTATPFRGVSEEETKRLVARYGRRRLDIDALGDDPYGKLQDMGVLARVRHDLLGGAEIELTETELDQLRRTRLVPSSVGDRVATDTLRNNILLESIVNLPADWPILLFAASVDHAQTLAALLSLEGISAAPISANTEPGARRHYIEHFRTGGLRVLTNYGVLTQGFDAPAIRAVYVARPTFSPNLYQQMIGRGLRGPLNGGKEECLIVNVADNVRQYGEELAFRQFEYLWQES
jgi:superfamily II DNA or RNA helicase